MGRFSYKEVIVSKVSGFWKIYLVLVFWVFCIGVGLNVGLGCFLVVILGSGRSSWGIKVWWLELGNFRVDCFFYSIEGKIKVWWREMIF